MHVGRYHVVGRLATGGMAEVLLGKMYGPSGFEQPVVLKRILPHLAAEPVFKGMFVQEARIAAHVRHPNVVRVYELMESGHELFLVMEYLEGETLSALDRAARAADAPLPLGLAAFIVAEAAAGLHAAHEVTDLRGHPQRLVHRDVSPQNIFVTYGGEVKVIDFGIAKAADHAARTSFAGLKGKFTYMSPEQTRGEPLDQRSDIFSLGIVLYELTTGRRLFSRANPERTLRAVCEDPIAPPSDVVPGYPEALEAVCMTALERDPERRYATALAMRRDLLEALRDLHPSAAPKEDLASLMEGLFAQHIQEKNAMLRVAPMEIHEAAVSSPPASEPPPEELSTVREGAPGRDAERAPRPRRARTRFRIVVALASCAALGALAYRLANAPPERRPKAPDVASAANPVLLTIDSRPSGAEVWMGPRYLGATPIELESPSSGETLQVELRKPGYVPKVVKVVPDANTSLEVELVPSKTGS